MLVRLSSLRAILLIALMSSIVAVETASAQDWECEDCGILSRQCFVSGSVGAVLCIPNGGDCLLYGSCRVSSAGEISPDGIRFQRAVAESDIGVAGALPVSAVPLPGARLRTVAPGGVTVTLDCAGMMVAIAVDDASVYRRHRGTTLIRI